jgi:hypothetical protein
MRSSGTIGDVDGVGAAVEGFRVVAEATPLVWIAEQRRAATRCEHLVDRLMATRRVEAVS